MTPDDDFSHDHEHDHDPKTEGEWVSNDPPVDDFGDDQHAESATVSEGDEHDHDHDPEDSSDISAEEKKKSPLLLLLGLVVTLAAVGGFAYWHFMGRQEQPSVLDVAVQSSTHEAAPNFVSKPSPPPAAAPVVAPAPDVAPKTAFSAPVSSPDMDKKEPQQAGSAMPAGVTPAAAPVGAAMNEAAAKPVAAMTAAAAPSPADEERISALSNRIDDLQKSLSQTTQQLGQINDKLATAVAPTASGQSQPDPALQERLNRLEQKLVQLEQQPKEMAAPVTHHVSVDTILPERSTKHVHHISSHSFTHHKMAAAKGKSNGWILRAATPDEAWVAKDAKTRELRPVHVGDELGNIGKVTSIQQVGDTWVVQGTHGTVR